MECSCINFLKKEKKLNNFCLEGRIDSRPCFFRIDTGSDVTILRENFLDSKKHCILANNCFLHYPTGETVLVENKAVVKIEIGKFCLDFPVFIAKIEDDCILGVDFLERVKLGGIFTSFFNGEELENQKNFLCSRISREGEGIPQNLLEFYEKNSITLDVLQKEKFAEVIVNFLDVFTEEIVAGNCSVIEHAINVNNSSPIKQVPRRVPLLMRGEVEKILEEMKQQGVIEESCSPWISPAVLVKKKDGTIRFCVDFRKLNAVTEKDSYPLPRIDDLLDRLSGNSWFTTLDLKSGYWQIKLRSQDKEKTAFSIGNGLWQFTVMPFGLCNAPATFERLMEKVLRPVLNKICMVYLDDVIIFGKTFEEMVENLREVFLLLRKANLKLNPKKCVFFKREVKYLGYLISEKGISTDPEKIEAVRNWPIPRSRKQKRILPHCKTFVFSNRKSKEIYMG